MPEESHLPVARSLPKYRSKAASAGTALAAATAATAGIMKAAEKGLNTWAIVALVAVGVGLLVNLYNAVNEVRGGRRTREVVVAISTVRVDRSVLALWNDRGHLRGLICVDLVGDDGAVVSMASLPIRLGEVLATSSSPVATLRALTDRKPPKKVKEVRLRFIPERSDQRIWLRELYDKDSLAGWLFDAAYLRERLGRTQFPPDVVIFTESRPEFLDPALALSPDPEGCLRVASSRDFSADHDVALPSLFNVLGVIRVSVSGSCDLEEEVDRKLLRENFSLYARLETGRQIQIVAFESVYLLREHGLP
jgi:hypothetical protein